MNDSQVTHSRIEYRNAVYQGSLLGNSRHGFGMLITDDADVFVAQWQNNIIHGFYVYMGNNIKAFGTMKQGVFSDFNVISYNGLTMYGYFRNNQMIGNVYLKSEQGLQVINYSNGRITEKFEFKPNVRVFDILKGEFKFEVFSLSEYLERLLFDSRLVSPAKFRKIVLSQNYSYFGFIDQRHEGQGLGCVLRKEGHLYSCGNYHHTELNGLGRMHPNPDEIWDGIFKSNMLKGFGVKYNIKSNNFTIGVQAEGKNEFDYYKGKPVVEIKEIRREFHLRSIQFVDEFIVSQLIINIKHGEQQQNNNVERTSSLISKSRYKQKQNKIKEIDYQLISRKKQIINEKYINLQGGQAQSNKLSAQLRSQKKQKIQFATAEHYEIKLLPVEQSKIEDAFDSIDMMSENSSEGNSTLQRTDTPNSGIQVVHQLYDAQKFLKKSVAQEVAPKKASQVKQVELDAVLKTSIVKSVASSIKTIQSRKTENNFVVVSVPTGKKIESGAKYRTGKKTQYNLEKPKHNSIDHIKQQAVEEDFYGAQRYFKARKSRFNSKYRSRYVSQTKSKRKYLSKPSKHNIEVAQSHKGLSSANMLRRIYQRSGLA